MTSSPVASEDQELEPLAAAFLDCLRNQADVIQSEIESITPMIAQARAILYVDTMMRLHEAGLEEAIKLNDATQSSAWMRDLSVVELSLSLLRNIQPLNPDTEASGPSGDAQISVG